MATFVSVYTFLENAFEKKVDMSGAELTVALTNTAHTTTWDELADLTQVSYTNLSARVITVTSSSQTAGTYKLILADLVLTATGAVGPFRYIYVYDDGSTGDKLCWYYDYGSSPTLADTDTFTINFDGTNGVFTAAQA